MTAQAHFEDMVAFGGTAIRLNRRLRPAGNRDVRDHRRFHDTLG